MLRLSFRELQVFATVARHMSFARAAEELHLSPPAVSMQVAGLEATLEVPLFERAGREGFAHDGGRVFPCACATLADQLEGRRRHDRAA
jgi:Transcriptional regulator